MVSKGVDPKSSRIFHQCYLKCCKLQNLTPLNNVIPSGNGKVLDICVDRIKYVDWPPILNALCCDLSLHSVSIKCRQQVKTVLEHIDCERLAKTVNKRPVILTNFMLTNLVEAIAQLLANTTLLVSLMLDGLPLRIPYLNPLYEALLTNSSLQHLYLPRTLIGDAGCLAVCKAVRCLPNILTLDLSGCELTVLGAGYIADLVKYQKIHRYSENWIHTLRYRLPELDTMAGLRRITLCGNPQLGDQGASKLYDVLADDLWIKDMRHNIDICNESLSKIRAALRENERGVGGNVYSWLGNLSGSSSDGRLAKSVSSKNGIIKDRIPSMNKGVPAKYSNKATAIKKEKDYAEVLEEQLQEEISHRQQLEELNLQLVDQMKLLKQHQQRLWANGAISSGSEQSFQASSRSCDLSSSSGSTSSVPIDQNTLSYIQQAFKDIYAFIKTNQCYGQCLRENAKDRQMEHQTANEITEVTEMEEYESTELRINIIPKKAQSTHMKMTDNVKMNKTTKSAHMLGDKQRVERCRDNVEMKPEMIERQMGDTTNAHGDDHSITDDIISPQNKPKKMRNNYDHRMNSYEAGSVSDSSDTLVYSPAHTRRLRSPPPNPRDALCSSDDEDSS
ncbi:unnamed protein product [Diatraea saccharalis]|uniref:Centrosomal protein of 78 kDa n=1 Tax=Diatraea saccharalis TaxID=40085 RepID=A0A9N9R9X5_9NEOP|nr:unnamed protein product [Diatraea saccharalis]